jgi:RIO kinase 2
MSSADVAVGVFRELKNEDLRVLQVIETAMSEHEFVPKEQIARFAKLNLTRDTDFRITRLSRLGLIYQMSGAYTGYTLNYAGYDCLAINGLVRANVIEAFGKPLGVGKEADVYDGLNPRGERIAVKFHRLGRISFRQTIRKRSYSIQRSASWLYQSRLAAEREYQALKILFSNRVAVPEPISQNRHVIAMGMIDGAELAEYRKIPRPEKILGEILRNIKRAFLKAGIIHADLSEYNVILKPNRHILIIDWPQYVTKEHPNVEELLTRDLQNILHYFKRRHKVDANLKETVQYVTGIRKNATVLVRPA